MPYAEVSVRSAPETIEEEINFSYHFEPDLSENGRWLVFSRVDPTENSGIFLFDLLNGDVIWVDRPVDGISSQGGSYNPTISGDGRWIAFSSNLENLYPGEKQDCYWNNQLIACMDVYIYDNQSGALERISQDQHGNGADGNNIYPAISPDGRWIAFWSSAKNLLDDGRESCGTEDQSQDCWDVFIYDREDGEFWRLPVGRAIDFVDVIRIYPLSLSDGGTHLALTIHARDQIANDLGISGTSGVYVFDRQRGEWLSGDWFTEGQNFIGSSFLPTLSSDGRYMAFVSTIDGLVSQDANKAADVFIVNLQDGEIELISLSTSGHSGDDYSGIMPEDTLIWGERLGLSDDGRYVVFLSKAGNLTAQPGVGCRVSQYSYCSEVYIHDRQTGRTIATITQPSGDGFYLFPGISGDGGTVYYVHFHLNCPQAPYCADILFYDRSTARITSPMLDDPEMAVEHPSAWRTLRYLDASDGGGVNGLAFSPDAETLAAGMSDGSIRRWSLPDGKTLAALKMHSRPVTNLAYDPGGYVLASASHDGTVGLWSAMDGALLRRLPGEAGAIFDLAFFPGGEILSVGAVRAAWNWDIRDLTFALWDYFSYSSEQVRAVAISPDGELMAHGLSDGSLWIRRVSTMDVIARLAHLDEINSLDFSPDGGYLASGSKDGLVHLWSITQGSGEYRIRLRTKFQHADWVNDLSFSVDSQWLAVASFGSDIHIWSTQEGGGNDLSLNAGGFQPLSITFSPDGRWLAAGSSWGGVRIWEVPIP